MPHKPVILTLAASHRADSLNRRLLTLATTYADATLEPLDYAALDCPPYREDAPMPPPAQIFADALRRVDGVMLATPEYNWSYPGSVKNLIDWASVATPNPFQGKVFFLLSATPSVRGGVLGLTHLRIPLESLGAFVVPQMFALSQAHQTFDAAGGLADPKLRDLLAAMVRQFITTTAQLSGRL